MKSLVNLEGISRTYLLPDFISATPISISLLLEAHQVLECTGSLTLSEPMLMFQLKPLGVMNLLHLFLIRIFTILSKQLQSFFPSHLSITNRYSTSTSTTLVTLILVLDVLSFLCKPYFHPIGSVKNSYLVSSSSISTSSSSMSSTLLTHIIIMPSLISSSVVLDTL